VQDGVLWVPLPWGAGVPKLRTPLATGRTSQGTLPVYLSSFSDLRMIGRSPHNHFFTSIALGKVEIAQTPGSSGAKQSM
jgi:hypothetical protein